MYRGKCRYAAASPKRNYATITRHGRGGLLIAHLLLIQFMAYRVSISCSHTCRPVPMAAPQLLPGLPFGAAPRFSQIWPLSFVFACVGDLWEAQKRKTAERLDSLRRGGDGRPHMTGVSEVVDVGAGAAGAIGRTASSFLEPPSQEQIVPALFCELSTGRSRHHITPPVTLRADPRLRR